MGEYGKLSQVVMGSLSSTSPDRSEPDELQIGITLGFDGYIFNTSVYYSYLLLILLSNICSFGFVRSAFVPSHSSGVLSSSVANLPTNLK